MKPDQTLKDLSLKKLELLDQLWTQTQLWVLNRSNTAFAVKQRLLGALEKTDRALEVREAQIGHLAKTQEKELYGLIRERLIGISELNQGGLKLLEVEAKELEAEQQSLNTGAKVVGYVKGQEPYTEARRLKAPPLQRGWKRGYSNEL
ncbi:MAG: hypothetical protein A2600_11285 [Candidatus Lambdaproteobacteria bacterium RIFOXYD1_FULL_56_27]|uniref:Uncharacterized protein n=1 Tax=Candidatus Lambdaproteobacteria bacterium RIFOXYD2_FULL_56_26 TaxID=1817773 RepID=A0A1F6GZF3_9PROT|nr:MAG: hypothetical protein A2426_08440 [Candidatus Lambdaproteobacteria bacterium RIFOXYC1_FULL_56_13]OGH03543.1 MAG: hypothetical protein A2557_01160 [Candidatus Lambdaproteobacteria bacterium RIFOXYD2_FULL_56_26]OGH07671.1 MAG: hypothetical protein A2600_11285 [Candidatus Lambdaproteobacteria bacterium RIFOXYD1_FULL_56_27]